jgi:hypothetical protein
MEKKRTHNRHKGGEHNLHQIILTMSKTGGQIAGRKALFQHPLRTLHHLLMGCTITCNQYPVRAIMKSWEWNKRQTQDNTTSSSLAFAVIQKK